jgi:hypothetical protein
MEPIKGDHMSTTLKEKFEQLHANCFVEAVEA